MSSIYGDREIKRTGDGVLTIGKEIGFDTSQMSDYGFSKGKKSLRVMLINPPVSFDVFYGEWDMSDVKSSSPPLGILSLAGMIREYGYPVKVIDAHADGLTKPDIISLVKEFKPDVVGVTAMTVMITAAAEIFKAIKEYDNDITTVIGGVHVTAEPTRTLSQYPWIDYAVIGEGEVVFTELLERMASNFQPETIQSLVWRGKEGTINVNTRRAFFKGLDEFPPPAFDLVPNLFNHYRLSVFKSKKFKSVGLVTSRGCTGKCTFCDLGVVGRGYRSNSAQYLIRMMKDLWKNYGVTDFLFYDDLFVGSRPRLKEVCDAIINEKLPFTWNCCARVDFMHTDMLPLMKKAGCWLIEYGIESGSQRIIDSMRKNISKEKIREVVEATTRAGIVTKGNFIFANPGEDHGSIKESIDFACSMDLTYFQHTFLTPLPGSELYETAAKYGTFDPSWDRMNTFTINFVPYGFTKQDLVNYSKYAWRRFYLRPHMMWRELKKIHGWEDMKRLWLAFKGFLKAAVFRKKLPEFVQRDRDVNLVH